MAVDSSGSHHHSPGGEPSAPAVRTLTPDATTRAGVLFKALSDKTRLTLLYIIAEHGTDPVCANELSTAIGMSAPTVTHHMKKLLDADLVTRTQQGKWAMYTINPVQFWRIHNLITNL